MDLEDEAAEAATFSIWRPVWPPFFSGTDLIVQCVGPCSWPQHGCAPSLFPLRPGTLVCRCDARAAGISGALGLDVVPLVGATQLVRPKFLEGLDLVAATQMPQPALEGI